MTIAQLYTDIGLIKDDTEIFIRVEPFKLVARGHWYEDKMLTYEQREIECFTWQDDNKIYIDLKDEEGENENE